MSGILSLEAVERLVEKLEDSNRNVYHVAFDFEALVKAPEGRRRRWRSTAPLASI
jgi:hypothetical protein